jgi:hypothetical protein
MSKDILEVMREDRAVRRYRRQGEPRDILDIILPEEPCSATVDCPNTAVNDGLSRDHHEEQGS